VTQPAKPSFHFKAPAKAAASSPGPSQENLDLFKEEAASYAPDLLTALERACRQPKDAEPWETSRRFFHTLKGAALTVGLKKIADFVSEAEKISLEASEETEKRQERRAEVLLQATRRMFADLGIEIPSPAVSPDPETKAPAPAPPAQAKTPPAPPQAEPPLPETPIDAVSQALEALESWKNSPHPEKKNAFHSAVQHSRQLAQKASLSRLATSFQHLGEFTEAVSDNVHTLCYTVVRRALEDARLYLQEREKNPQLTWNRKWGFYFSSLRIALASELKTDSPTAEAVDPEMLETFIEEAVGIFEQIEGDILAWEKRDAPGERQASLRRHFHTLKGAANSIELTAMGSQFHALEDFMETQSPETPSEQLFTFLLRCLDEVRREIERLQEDPYAPCRLNWSESIRAIAAGEPLPEPGAGSDASPAIDPEMLEVFIEEAGGLYEPIENSIMQWEQGQDEKEQKAALRRHFHTLKGAANSVGLRSLGTDFHTLEDYMETLDTEQAPDQLFGFLLRCLDEIRHYVQSLESDPTSAWKGAWKAGIEAMQSGGKATPETGTPQVETAPKEAATLRVDAGQLRNLMNLITEMIADRHRFQDNIHSLTALYNDMTRVLDGAGAKQSPDRVQEWSQSLARMLERFKDDTLSFNRQSKQVQGELAEMNMGPVSTLFRRLSRSFRDACQEEQKEATWSTEGEGTQLDRTVLEHLYGPLLHVVRNAVAHGIEPPDQREAKGKARSGTVHISAVPQANQVVLEIRDDGAGINGDAVLKRGIERGLVPAETTSLTHDEVVGLLFTPGFSTKEQVSSVAGRGVGLDVVKGEIEALNGSVGVHYEVGKGTTWKIKVPLSLTASEALLVRVADGHLAIPLSYVDTCIQIHPDLLSDRDGRPQVKLKEETLPYLAMTELLQLPTDRPVTHGVIVDSGIDRAVFGVQGLHSRREIVVKDLGPFLENFSLYSGVTADTDGSLIPILQVPNLLQTFTREFGTGSAPATEKEQTRTPPAEKDHPIRVLLADDSASVRKMQNRELTKYGFQVTLAEHGASALEMLQEDSFDLLITDWEMPHLDGERLIRTLRNHENETLKNLPIIVISSRVDDEFASHAREVGANLALPKPFDTHAFHQGVQDSQTISHLAQYAADHPAGKRT
jgi:chemotaxis protein histidine kinase CheA/FixJ family two-component response regulator